MRISPIKSSTNFSKPAFKGYTIEGYGYRHGHLHAAENSGRRIEKTLGGFHNNITGKIYYTDPLEKVNDNLREMVDYVVYDDEPKFPDINNEVSKLYFGTDGDQWEIKKRFKDSKDYFYRLEMADSKTVGEYEQKVWNNIDKENSTRNAEYFKAHVNDAKYNQETIANCEAIFKESDDLRYKKDNIASEISSIKNSIRHCEADIPRAEMELNHRTEIDKMLTEKIKNLQERKNNYTKILEQLDTNKTKDASTLNSIEKLAQINSEGHHEINRTKIFTYNDFISESEASENFKETKSIFEKNMSKEASEKNVIIENIEKLTKSISEFTERTEKNQAYIKKISDYIKALPKLIAERNNDLVKNTQEFEKVKADLIPYFDKLKNYFYSRGLRTIR